MPTPATIYAAGVLCWRETPEGVRVLLVRRPDYDDLTIPKGKLDPGELLPQTAVRELHEETGVRATLGAPIGSIRYSVKGAPKFVQYWLAEVSEEAAAEAAAEFQPNEEISAVEWLPMNEAALRVSYPHDAEMIRDLGRRIADGTARTFAIIVVRHGKALPATDWDGPDSRRPLLHRGEEQAALIAPSLAAFGPERIVTSPAARCFATILPLTALTGLPVKTAAGISQDAYQAGKSKAAKQIAKRIRKHQSVVICTHGPVIPELVVGIRSATGARASGMQRAANLSTGDFAVFHLTPEEQPRLVEVEVHSAG